MMNIKDDSRKVVPGDTFIALRGVESDGHSYIDAAIKNGATRIIAEEGTYSVDALIVTDTREYLIKYLKDTYGSDIATMRFIGITGTNGKTTCAFLVHNMLNQLGEKTAYIGTIGFYIIDKINRLDNTTPDLIALYNMMLDAKAAGCVNMVMELSSQGLAYKRVDGLEFDYAAFTNLTQDHLDFHLTMENYAIDKQRLFKKLKTDGKAIVNFDDAYKNYFLLPDKQNYTYGINGGDFRITDYKMSSQNTTFTYQYKDEVYNTETTLIGKYNLYNLLLVIALMYEMGYKDISKMIPVLKAPPGRMQIINYKNNMIIIDYAHTPDAIEKILEIAKKVLVGKLYVVFGCTGDRDRLKRPIMTKMVTNAADLAIITNEDPHTEDEQQIINDMIAGSDKTNYIVELDRAKAIAKGIDMLTENDMLLILGKGHEEFIIMKDHKIPFNDFETVSEYLKNHI